MGVTSFLLLSSLGLVITTQAQNCPPPVGGPNMNLKGDDINLETFPDGTRVSFDCIVGYTRVGGSAVVTCSAGTWSPVRLICERKNCGPAGDVNRGHVDYPTGTEFGDTAVFNCDDGHLLVGSKQIICGDRGWMGRLPVCEVVNCDPPPAVVNATFSPNKESYEYREVVIYTCINDNTLNGSKQLSCSDDEQFKPDPPTCVLVRCGEPKIENGGWRGGARPPYKHSATVRLQCNTGYIMEGADTQTCDINSQWSPGLPKCILKAKPPTTTTTTTTTTKTTTTTTTTLSPKKPSASPGPDDPRGDGSSNTQTVGIIVGVSATVLLVQHYWM